MCFWLSSEGRESNNEKNKNSSILYRRDRDLSYPRVRVSLDVYDQSQESGGQPGDSSEDLLYPDPDEFPGSLRKGELLQLPVQQRRGCLTVGDNITALRFARGIRNRKVPDAQDRIDPAHRSHGPFYLLPDSLVYRLQVFEVDRYLHSSGDNPPDYYPAFCDMDHGKFF